MVEFWIVALYTPVEIYRLFRGACCLYRQGDEAKFTRLHGWTTQKTSVFILASVRTWNLILFSFVFGIANIYNRSITGKKDPFDKMSKSIKIRNISCQQTDVRHCIQGVRVSLQMETRKWEGGLRACCLAEDRLSPLVYQYFMCRGLHAMAGDLTNII
jgi:hypothetical protein